MGVLETIAVILVFVWILGLVFHILGGFIHIVLVVAIILFVVRFFQRRA